MKKGNTKKILKGFKSLANVNTTSNQSPNTSTSSSSSGTSRLVNFNDFRWHTQNTDTLFGNVKDDKGEIFGRPLDHFKEIPDFLTEIVSFLKNELFNNKSSSFEGIFRKNGCKDLIADAVEVLDIGEEFPLDDLKDHFKNDIHNLCGLFAFFFSKLEEPLLGCSMYDEWIKISQIKDKGEKEKEITKMIPKYSKIEKKFLSFFFLFMQFLTNNEIVKKTKMGSENLSFVFAPKLLRPKVLDLTHFQDAGTIVSLVKTIIENANIFFDDDSKEGSIEGGLHNPGDPGNPKFKINIITM